MKFLNRVKMMFTPKDDNDATNKIYVDDTIKTSIDKKVKTTATDAGKLTGTDTDGNIVPIPYDSKAFVYAEDEDVAFIDDGVANIKDADTLHGMTWDEFATKTHTHTAKDIGLDQVTNNKQIKALDTVAENNVPIFGADGSLLKDSGFTIGKSVPSDASFTDTNTTYSDTTNETSGLFNPTYKKKVDSLDVNAQIFHFTDLTTMKSYDMSTYPYQYAYGVVGDAQYRWKTSNEVISDTGKWRVVNEMVGEIISITGFTLNDKGVLSANVVQKNTDGAIVSTDSEVMGKIAPIPRDTWVETETYNKLDFVIYTGILYMCKDDNIKGVQVTDATKWMPCSEKALDNYQLYLKNTLDDTPLSYPEWAAKQKGADGKDGTIITDISRVDDNLKITVSTGNIDDPATVTDESKKDYDLGRVTGLSAYEVAKNNGFTGTESEWLDSLKGGAGASHLENKHSINGIGFDGTTDITNYAECQTTADVSEKTVTLPGFEFDTGADISVRFDNGNTTDSITLKVNDLEAKDVFYNGQKLNGKLIKNDLVINMRFDGAKFIVVGIMAADINPTEILEKLTGEIIIDKLGYTPVDETKVPSASDILNNLTSDEVTKALGYTPIANDKKFMFYTGEITFANLPTTGLSERLVYKITDDFTTTDSFSVGAGATFAGGTTIIYMSDSKWHILNPEQKYLLSKDYVVDNILDDSSTNPVQNEIVAKKFTSVDNTIKSLGESVANGKASIALAITNKGVTTASDATFATMVTNIGSIQSGSSSLILASNPSINIIPDDSSAIVTWSTPSTELSISSYNIYSYQSDTKPTALTQFTKKGNVNNSVLSYTVTGLTNSATQWIAVESVGSNNVENASMINIKSIVPIPWKFITLTSTGQVYILNPTSNTWNSLTSLDTSKTYSDVTYGNGMFICLGSSGSSYKLSSTNIWTPLTGLDTSRLYKAIAYGNGIFVCVAYTNLAAYTVNYTTWVQTTMVSSTYTCFNVAFCGDRFISITSAQVSSYSTNGASWIAMTGLSSSPAYFGICYGNGRTVCVGSSGASYYSTNGTSWVAMSTIMATSYAYNEVAYGLGRFVCISNGGVSYYSTDGMTWVSMSGLSSSSNCTTLTFNGDRFICIGSSGASYYSTNGTSWVTMSAIGSSSYSYVSISCKP